MATTKFYNIREVDPGDLKDLIWTVQRTGQRIIFRDENRPIGALIPHQQLPGDNHDIREVSPRHLKDLIWTIQSTGQRIIFRDRGRPIADLIPHQGIPSYPQNYMTMLDTLYNSERWDELHSRFNFFAFMVHDSKTHPDFDQQIKEYLFDPTDQFMNENDKLLFFALVDSSPQENRDSNSPRDQNTQDVPEPSRAAISLTHSIASIDPSIRAISLAKSLEISNERLPCLVVTPDLHSKQFRWLRTDPDSLEDQLYHLRNMAYRVQGFGRFGKERIISEYLQQISPSGENGTTYLMGERNFGSALTNVMTFTVAGHSPFPEEMEPAWEKTKDVLLDLQDDLRKTKQSLSRFQDARKQSAQLFDLHHDKLGSNLKTGELEEHFSEILSPIDEQISETTLLIEGLCEKIASDLASLMPYRPNLKNFIGINEAFLEDDSCRMLKTAQAVLDMLNHPDFATLDYTPGVICLAKTFEREVNLSVVHWIRQQLNVELPAYFDRFQVGLKKAEFAEVNFNARGNHKKAWRPPTLGASERACNAVDKDKSWGPKMIAEWNDKGQWKMLLDNWQVITEKRNVGAHQLSVDKSVADDIKNALDKLNKKKIFDELYRMKKIYRGDITIPDTNLRGAIEEALKKSSGAIITVAEMGELGKDRRIKFCTADKGICDLTGLEFASNLQRLHLNENHISDLSPLSKLTNLKFLNLKNNAIKNIQPLMKLPNLKGLYLVNNPLNDISIEQHIPDLEARGVTVSF